MNKVLKIKNSLIIFLTVLVLFSCKKKSTDYVPTVTVNTYLSASDPAFAPLNAINGSTYLSNCGVAGILVFRKSQTEFMAYDRCCTYKVSEGNVIAVDASGLISKDAVCGSQFILTDGSVNNGPASNPLKRYQTTFDGTVLHIFN